MAGWENDRVQMTLEAARKAAFAAQLRKLMTEQNLTVTMLAQRVGEVRPGKTFNSVNLSHYRSGRSVPRMPVLAALAQALGVTAEELLPAAAAEKPRGRGRRASAASEEAAPAFHLEDLKGGEAFIQINQRMSWPMALKLLQVLKGEDES